MKRLDIIATCLVLSFFIFSTEAQLLQKYWYLPFPQGSFIPHYPQYEPQFPQNPYVPQIPQDPYEPQQQYEPQIPPQQYEPQIPQQQYEPQGPGSNMQSSCSNCVCGINKRSRIVGGQVDDVSNYPWMVRMLGMTSQGKTTLCGASLISSKYVLTAAHCVDGHTADVFIIRLADQTEHRVKRIIKHEYYSKGTMNNDIALMELQTPVKLGNGVSTVCLPKSGIDYTSQKVATVIGYGKLSEENVHSEKPLSKVDVPIIPVEHCRTHSHYASQNIHITNNMICAGYIHGEQKADSCQGDSGGPLFVKGAKGESIQAGVVSFGIGCARLGYPGIYTNVGNYRDWIQRNMRGDCLCPAP